MSGQKTFINNTNQYVNVTLLIRQGDDIHKQPLEQTFPLNANETKKVTYGDQSNIYLNGLVFQWKDTITQSMSTDRQEVIATGTMPTFDAMLNTNNVISINSLKGLDISVGN